MNITIDNLITKELTNLEIHSDVWENPALLYDTLFNNELLTCSRYDIYFELKIGQANIFQYDDTKTQLFEIKQVI